jgi:hypothetical protein
VHGSLHQAGAGAVEQVVEYASRAHFGNAQIYRDVGTALRMEIAFRTFSAQPSDNFRSLSQPKTARGGDPNGRQAVIWQRHEWGAKSHSVRTGAIGCVMDFGRVSRVLR